MREQAMLITTRVLEDLAVGCTILAGGGGGDPRIGTLMASAAIAEHGPVRLVTGEELADDDYVLAVGMMGAPTVMAEKIPHGGEAMAIRDAMQRLLGHEIAALLPFELGGMNGSYPIAWAARCGIPLVDADLMGRAFPELQMCVPHLHGVVSSPTILADERLQLVVLQARDNVWVERLARDACVALGGCASVGLYPMPAATARHAVVSGSISEALRVGGAVRAGGTVGLGALQSLIGARPLITGKVVDIERRTTTGFVRGSVVIEGVREDAGRLVRIAFQNENLLALEDGQAIATVPDIITLIDPQTMRGITTEQIRYGQRVTASVLPGPEMWRTPAGLAVVGPRAFGYDFDYVGVDGVHEPAG